MTKYASSHRLETKEITRLHTGAIRNDLLRVILHNVVNDIKDDIMYTIKVKFYPVVSREDNGLSTDFVCEVELD